MAFEFRIKNGLIANGSATISGSIDATGNITAPQLVGTASYATQAVTASFTQTASYVTALSQSVAISGSLNANNTLFVTGSRVGVNTSVNAGYTVDISGSTRILGNITGTGALAFTIPSPNAAYANGSVSAAGSAYSRPYSVDFTLGNYSLQTMDSQIHFGGRFQGVFFNGGQMYNYGTPTQIWGTTTGPNNVSRMQIGVNSTGEYQQGANYPSASNNYFYLQTEIVNPTGSVFTPPSSNPVRRSFVLSANELIMGTGASYVERMRIGSDGKVGIGTATPTASLHIQAASSASTDLALVIRASGSVTDLLSVRANGNSGFKTTTDSGYVVDINGTARVTSNLTVDSPIIRSGTGVQTFLLNSSGESMFRYGRGGASSDYIAIGRLAGHPSASAQNTIIGAAAGNGLTSGTSNTLVGYAVMNGANTSYNTCVGSLAGQNLSGTSNTIIGANNFNSPSTINGNSILIGAFNSNNNLNTAPTNIILIGNSNYVATSSAVSNAIYIGNSLKTTSTTLSNVVILGRSDQNVLVGEPTTNDGFKFDVSGSGRYTNGLTVTGSINGVTLDNAAWTSYTPAWTAASTDPVLGDGTITGAYKIIGKTCFVRMRLQMGSTTTYGSGAWYFSLPATAASPYGIIMPATMLNDGTAWYSGTVNGGRNGSSTKSEIQWQNTSGTADGISSTVPFTWGVSDELEFNGSYEIA